MTGRWNTSCRYHTAWSQTLLAGTKSMICPPSDIRVGVFSEYLNPLPQLVPALQLHHMAPGTSWQKPSL